MADAVQPKAPENPAGLGALAHAAERASAKGPPPVETWNPPFCGDIDMRIARDGSWRYLGSPIGRPALVKLFASILRKDAEGFRLVTPVEKVGIIVEDAPFIAVEMQAEAGVLRFRTNVDDIVEAGEAHSLRFERGAAEGIKPYLHVRGGLWALLSRPLLYELTALGEKREIMGREMFGIASGGVFFAMAPMALIEGVL